LLGLEFRWGSFELLAGDDNSGQQHVMRVNIEIAALKRMTLSAHPLEAAVRENKLPPNSHRAVG
jgi:hypothetical protein